MPAKTPPSHLSVQPVSWSSPNSAQKLLDQYMECLTRMQLACGSKPGYSFVQNMELAHAFNETDQKGYGHQLVLS